MKAAQEHNGNYKNYVLNKMVEIEKLDLDVKLAAYDSGNGLRICEDVGEEVATVFLMGADYLHIAPPSNTQGWEGDWDENWNFAKTKVNALLDELNEDK